jgi:hypothetical protein
MWQAENVFSYGYVQLKNSLTIKLKTDLLNMMKFSRAISRVKWSNGEQTNVSKTSKRWFAHRSTICPS